MVGINRITIDVEPNEQMSSSMIADGLRELAESIGRTSRTYDYAVRFNWFNETTPVKELKVEYDEQDI